MIFHFFKSGAWQTSCLLTHQLHDVAQRCCEIRRSGALPGRLNRSYARVTRWPAVTGSTSCTQSEKKAAHCTSPAAAPSPQLYTTLRPLCWQARPRCCPWEPSAACLLAASGDGCRLVTWPEQGQRALQLRCQGAAQDSAQLALPPRLTVPPPPARPPLADAAPAPRTEAQPVPRGL